MRIRYRSLDVFRGATVCLMILVNNPGSWAHIYAPLEHAPWHGLTPTDLVFPFFLFAVGNAMAFVMPRLQEAGPTVFWKKIIKRTLMIFGIGLFLNWYPFMRWNEGALELIPWTSGPEKGVRIFGVLQRIAVCYFFASIIAYYLKPRAAALLSVVLLLLYWALCIIGNPADPYSLVGWFGTEWVDKLILHTAHMYKGEGVPFDPEGIASTLPAIVQVVFGYLVGMYIRNCSTDMPEPLDKNSPANPMFKMLTGLFVAGIALLLTGFCWDMVFPINKKIWTSSYTVYTTGLAIVTIATMIYFIEIRQKNGFLGRFFEVFGKNPLFIFALSAFLPKTAALFKTKEGVTPWNWLYTKVLVYTPGAKENGSLLYALCVILFMWAICYWLDKRKIYIKV
ncbi:heparan-alpha-glucosaminide N-acetyltransferase domain-containing protein [Niabella sp. CC-SYL272]|uniref:acyltransferase family protein n=1 Tax=Niabella agricola TaxID=2891571 RepID=UPI001F30EDC8|nr:heparan-alpha-glucosaminide N-acetyltransferase domain-containing protein [Niabella agricola]MCF3109952.1 heparan-alpha-glucosaminide N-acetyltransferase domain-containing protein [Niabella agricola]